MKYRRNSPCSPEPQLTFLTSAASIVPQFQHALLPPPSHTLSYHTLRTSSHAPLLLRCRPFRFSKFNYVNRRCIVTC
ncbi:hypothetical protein M413DRAFT_285646 [Hebeloma cylindrosporum]|uniref:Uncharacterized protein n=1 Tax=Hebeloma cylindrosporum TaxID=76867 RepID=A0A0C2XFC3_HEBCY|nr:hypothetical protein M413DRAFT_285646 [Hebeloma cylindrosporum h7]